MRPVIAVLAILLATPAVAAQGFKSEAEFSDWLTYYYVKPDPERLPAAVLYMSESGVLEKESAVPPIFGFLSGVFRANPARVPTWLDQLATVKEAHLPAVILGVWYANLPNSQNLVYQMLKKHPGLNQQLGFLHQGAPMLVTAIALEQGPWVLDVLWGSFMATGSKEPVARIISTLLWMDVKGDTNRLLVGGSARWSLTSNAVQHKRVLQICQTEVSKQPKDVADKLREVIAAVKKEPRGGAQQSVPGDAPLRGSFPEPKR